MCRITGFIEFHKNSGYDHGRVVNDMRDTMTYGGPDDAGNYIDAENGVALGHRRLSIIDLSPSGHQPMIDGELVITFNGEIYNYEEIKKELEEEGVTFKTHSDTEVILKAYRLWGMDAVSKFRGMWAFAIWDTRAKKLTLCRDRAGVKPLYWYFKDGLFMFSSEMKAFLKHPKFTKKINAAALGLYFQYGYITSPHSIFENAYKLEPGSFLTIDSGMNIKKAKYWKIEDHYLKTRDERLEWMNRSDAAVMEELEALLADSFKLRMVADVPVGMFLSGGIDSSLLTAILSKDAKTPLKTFTIGFHEKEYNEAEWAKKVAAHLGTDHTELYCTTKEAFEIIPKLPGIYDEPFGDASAIPTHLVSALARKSVTVSLSADGGDEQFCGYSRYFMISERIKKITRNPFAPMLSGVLDLISPETAFSIYEKLGAILPKWHNFRDKFAKLKGVLKISDGISQYDFSNKYFLNSELSALGIEKNADQLFKYDRSFDKQDILTRMMFLDINTYLPDDVLTKVDRAGMSVALEGRDPFLDGKILEYSAKLPLKFKYRDGVSKFILKQILYKYVPRELIDRPKQGFGVPVHEWFKNDLKELYIEHLAFDKVRREGILNAEAVSKLLDDYLAGRGVNAYKLWFLFMFELWFEKYM